MAFCQQSYAQAMLPDPRQVPAAFMRLIQAAKYVEIYQASAVVSARVFRARAQGSDREYAEFMGYVAKTDLESVKPCLAFLASKHDISEGDAVDVAAFFESPIGVRLLKQSQEVMLQTIEQLRPVQPNFEGWSEEDRGRLIAIYQSVAFRKYSALASNRSFAEGSVGCYKAVLSMKNPGVQF